MSDKSDVSVVTVKIDARVHQMAKKIAAFTGKTLEEVLSEALTEPLTEKFKQVVGRTDYVSSTPDTASEFRDWPVYWFAALERAVGCGNHQEAAEAQMQLKRLGVDVRYGRPKIK